MNKPVSQEDKLAALRQIIKDVDICMLSTRDESGEMHSRPMSNNQDVDFDGDLWFFISDDSAKVHEVQRDERVNASFADPKGRRYVSLSGTAEVVRDPDMIKVLWKPEYKIWFPEGPQTPGIALLKVSATQAEYWDASQSLVSHAIKLVSAMVAGKQPDLGKNEKLKL